MKPALIRLSHCVLCMGVHIVFSTFFSMERMIEDDFREWSYPARLAYMSAAMQIMFTKFFIGFIFMECFTIACGLGYTNDGSQNGECYNSIR